MQASQLNQKHNKANQADEFAVWLPPFDDRAAPLIFQTGREAAK